MGFVVHPTKSILKPSQEIVTLGFLIHSINMTTQLTKDKAIRLKEHCKTLLKLDKPKLIREVATIIGQIVASFPGVMYGPLYYRYLEQDKSEALIKDKGNFDEYMVLSTEAKSELNYQTLEREPPKLRCLLMPHSQRGVQSVRGCQLVGSGQQQNPNIT